MRLTDKEEKIARLALDKGAQSGERDSAAIKLINSLHARGVTVEDIEKVVVREKVIVQKVLIPVARPAVAQKAPEAVPRPSYSPTDTKTNAAEKGFPDWTKTAALSFFVIAIIAGMSVPLRHLTQPPQVSGQVQPSPQPTVPRPELVTPKEKHVKRHPRN